MRSFKPVKELVASKQTPPITPADLKRVMEVMKFKKFELEEDDKES